MIYIDAHCLGKEIGEYCKSYDKLMRGEGGCDGDGDGDGDGDVDGGLRNVGSCMMKP